jgi:hypothetical protein
MLQVVTYDCGLQFTGQSLDIKIILNPVLVGGARLLLNNPAWAHFLSAKINNTLIVPDMLHRSLENWIVQGLLSAFVANCCGRHTNQERDT